ncbi:MAG: hypothetical protein COB60_01165 [Flavobacteriaceae bacterium]|nr:MAG: hypothetical protein COB60_01165 [Flavobacteriaceae bacterium]
MKKIILLLSLVLFVGTTSLFATNGDPEVSKKELKTQIVKLLENPHVYIEKEIVIEMIFTFTPNGKIIVVKLHSKDNYIKKYIRKNLNMKKFKKPGKRDELYSISLRLKPYGAI